MGDGFVFEACVDSVHSALAAQRGGAGRLELCSNLLLGGTTPSYGLVKMVKEQVHIPVHVLIRPRSGHFVFSCTELKVMIEDIKMVGQLGVQGVAIGVLTEDNKINVEQMRALLEPCGLYRLSVTFHRAFDVLCDPLASLEILVGLGVDRVLTSGQEASAVCGIQLIHLLVMKAEGRIGILPAGGISESNAAQVLRRTGVTELHGSVRSILKESVHVLPGDQNTIVWTVDSVKVQKIVSSCNIAAAVDSNDQNIEKRYQYLTS
ncbi:unnamed protein product [Sphagnum troendelagicum]|uniref:Copper homeostasis protein cutC homolog n=1 Tax=Sphagnum troendelagicum TaxID=128251 RepID=A0ABP0TLZ0_9BRYO